MSRQLPSSFSYLNVGQTPNLFNISEARELEHRFLSRQDYRELTDSNSLAARTRECECATLLGRVRKPGADPLAQVLPKMPTVYIRSCLLKLFKPNSEMVHLSSSLSTSALG